MKINADWAGNLFVYLLIGLIGCLMAIPMAYKIYDHLRFQHQSTAVFGVITDTGCVPYFGCKPFVQYVDTKNRIHTFRSRVNFYFFAPPKKGQKIAVFFLNKDHQTAIIGHHFYQLIQPFCFFSVGLFVLIVLLIRIISSDQET